MNTPFSFLANAKIVRKGIACAALMFLSLAGSASKAGAQETSRNAAQLPQALSVPARATIAAIVDSAQLAGLPVDPLLDRAAEGVLKGADEQRIIAAVRVLARELGEARALLHAQGSAAAPLLTTPVLNAIAGALHAGIAPANLQQVTRTAAVRGATDAEISDVLVSALVTLVDLVAKRISPAAAISSIDQLLERRALSVQFANLRSDVSRDIRLGQAPDGALATSTRAQVRAIQSTAPERQIPGRPPVIEGDSRAGCDQ